MENGNPRDSAVLLVLSILLVPIVLAYLWTLSKSWLEKVDNLDIADKYFYANNYTENKDKRTRQRPKHRERPPNASFFCRVDGKETKIEGPYEEEFLTKIETIKWEVKKRRRANKKRD